MLVLVICDKLGDGPKRYKLELLARLERQDCNLKNIRVIEVVYDTREKAKESRQKTKE